MKKAGYQIETSIKAGSLWRRRNKSLAQRLSTWSVKIQRSCSDEDHLPADVQWSVTTLFSADVVGDVNGNVNAQGSPTVRCLRHGQTVHQTRRWITTHAPQCIIIQPFSNSSRLLVVFSSHKQEVKVIRQKAPHGGPIPRLGVTPGGRKLYHWIPGVGFPISVP